MTEEDIMVLLIHAYKHTPVIVILFVAYLDTRSLTWRERHITPLAWWGEEPSQWVISALAPVA